MRPRWVTLANALDDSILKRPVRKLLASDAPKVKDICWAMCAQQDRDDFLTQHYCRKTGSDEIHRMPATEGLQDTVTGQAMAVSGLRCNQVAHFFVARFYDGWAFQIRAHLLTDISEDNAHSHGASFFSHCVSGAYTHEIWEKYPWELEKVAGSNTKKRKLQEGLWHEEKDTETATPCFFETIRVSNSTSGSCRFSGSKRVNGRFESCFKHEHKQGDLYFMDAGPIYHKVCVRQHHLDRDAQAPCPIVSVCFRDKESSYKDSHFVTVGSPLAEDVMTNSVQEFNQTDTHSKFTPAECERRLQQLREAMSRYGKEVSSPHRVDHGKIREFTVHALERLQPSQDE